MLHGHKTSVSLEAEFWDNLKRIAARKRLRVSALIMRIDADRDSTNLSSAIRLFVLQDLQARLAGIPELIDRINSESRAA
jgi:predicted DNA-binding ribbon-helix-helix protein